MSSQINSQTQSMPSAQIRGASAYTLRAAPTYRILAAFLDIGIASSLFFGIFILVRALPLPGAFSYSLLAGFVFCALMLQKFFLGITLGERIWGMRSMERFTLNPPLVQALPPSALAQSVGIFLTLSSFMASLAIAYGAIALHPIGMAAEAQEWQAFFPGFSSEASFSERDRWNVMPFYYSLGAWPRSFKSKPIFLNIPYEKGPPLRFAGEISARWDNQIKITFEGPKSPLSSEKELYDRTEIQRCVLGLWNSLSSVPHCLKLRSDVLGRHVDALRKLKGAEWSLRWISVANQAIPAEQTLQGIYLSAHNESRGQDRFIMITAKGTHQAFIFDYTNNENGIAAREDFVNSLRSIRVSDDLAPGRVWVDQSLEKVDLRDVTKLGESPEAIQKIAEIQSLLIARISVDPKTYDTYFHLAGTALMLGRAATKLRQLAPPQGNPELAAELLTVAKPMVQTAMHYAQDVAPQESRNKFLQGFWAESQKF